MTQFLRSSGGVSITDLLKDGAKHFSGVDEAVLKNIEACKKLSEITRTSIGPNGMNKIVVNHIGKQFVTSDAATIVKEMEVNVTTTLHGNDCA
jgi:T-complex protein 1 subunit theta